MNNKKILLIGANGFIGKNLCEKLSLDYTVIAPNRRQLNLLNQESTEEFLKREKFDIIIHCANVNNTRRKDTTPYDSLDGNLRMFFNIERCKEYYGKMYYFGSGAEYDSCHYACNMSEEYFDTYVPTDSYGFSKYVMAKACDKNDNIYDLRLFGVYGKYEEWERRFISNAICRALKGMDITIHQNVYFDYLWVDDLANIMRWFIEHKPKYHHYNVCSGRKIDLYTLANMIRSVLEIDCNILVEKSGFKQEYTGDNHRLLQELGDYQYADYEETIKSLGDYYGENIDSIKEEMLI